MHRNKVIELARDAGLFSTEVHVLMPKLERFAALIEREVRGDAEPVGYTNEGYKGMQYANAEAYKDIRPDFIERNKLTAPLFAHPAPAVGFEFSDKGLAEVVVCQKGLTYGVQCVDFPKVFAQFTFESDAKQFVNIFNGTVALRVESPDSGGGGGFESRPVPTNAPAVVRQLVEALETLVGWEEAEAEHFDAEAPDDWIMDKARRALAAAKGKGL